MSQFGEFISKSTLGAINVGLHSASDETMRSLLGHPKGTLTEDCQNDLASDTVQRLSDTRNFGLFRATGIKPADQAVLRIGQPELDEAAPRCFLSPSPQAPGGSDR